MEKVICRIDSAFQNIRKGDRVFLGSLGMEDEEFRHLLSKDTNEISVLHLSINNISWLSLLHMRQASWKNLIDLNLGGNIIVDNGCKFIAKVEMPKLKQLRLWENHISSIGLIHLSKACLKQLQQLFLNENNISGDQLRCLTKANWSKMKTIYLSGNKLFEDQMKKLLYCQLPSLNIIFLHRNYVDGYIKAELKSFFRSKFYRACNISF